MDNIIQIKTGSRAPDSGFLAVSELGFDKQNKDLYIGLEENGLLKLNYDDLKDFGITASATEINVLDGVIANTTQLNYLVGVTSGIQSQLDNKVTLNTTQTITDVKTFKASNIFDGEQKYFNTTHCPTVTDTAGGVGCAFKASRGLFNEALIDKIIMTSSTKKIPFYKYTGASGGAMTGLTEVASIDTNGSAVFNGTIHIKSTADASGTSESTIPPLTIGDRSGSHMVIDGNEIISKNGTGAMQTLYLQDAGGETKACGDLVVAGKIKGIIKQLWTNSNSSATFTAQDISLNYSGYNTLILIFRRRTDSATCCTVTIPAASGASYQSIINYVSGNTAKIQKRDFTINASSISFGAGWQQGSTNGTDNNANIPVAIWAF